MGVAGPLGATGASSVAVDPLEQWLSDQARKPSFKTGEFWLLVMGVAGVNWLMIHHKVDPDLAVWIDLFAPLGFQWLRQNFKSDAQERVLALLQTNAKGLEE